MSRINGRRVADVIPVIPATPPGPAHTHAHTPAPACPKHCDVATPPEHTGGRQYVCTACGTEFTWKESPP